MTAADPNAYSSSTIFEARDLVESTGLQANGTVLKRSQFEYFPAGNLKTQKHWDDVKGSSSDLANYISRSYLYTTRGNRRSETDARGNTVTYEFNAIGCTGAADGDLYPTKMIRGGSGSVAQNWVFSYNCTSGMRTSVTDPNSLTAAIEYDNFNRPTVITEGGLRKTAHLYSDSKRWVMTRNDTVAAADQNDVTVAHFDQLGRVRLTRQLETAPAANATADSIADAETQGIKTETRYLLNASGNDLLVSNPFRDSETEGRGWTATRTDKAGRPCAVETFDGAAAPALAANCGATSGATGRSTVTYDAATGGTPLVAYSKGTTTDPAGVAKSEYRDVLNRLIAVVEAPSSLKYATYYSYDSLNRVIQKSYSDGTPTVTYTFDTGCAENGKGRLCQVSNSVATTTFSYDDLGRVKSSTQTMFGNAYGPFAYTYDVADNLLSETYPSGRVVSYQYHKSGRASELRTQKASQPSPDVLATGLLYSAHGAMRRMSLLSGKTEEWCYNSRLQTTRIRVGNAASAQNNCDQAGSDLMWLGLGYRTGAANNGDIVSQNIQPVSLSQTFGYDSLGRLSTFADPQFSETYGYDRWGNRWLTARTGGIPSGIPNGSSWYDPGKNQMRVTPGSTQPACPNALYDCAGNQVSVLGVQLTYDGENRVAEAIRTVGGVAEIYRHYYDGEGRRVGTAAKVGGVDRWTTAFVYDAMGKMVAEYTGGAGPATTAGRTFVSVDHLGSTRMTTDGSGGSVRRFDYLPFGESLGTAGRTVGLGYAGEGPRMMFTGKERDAETGLDYFGARYMSSVQGRWLSVDPAGPAASHLQNPQKWNRYSYVLNNPFIHIDPDGRAEVKVTVRAYIPQGYFELPAGVIWRGDARGHSTAPNASHRASTKFVLETDPHIRANPLVSASAPTSSGSQVGVQVRNTRGIVPGFITAQALEHPDVQLSATRDSNGSAVAKVSLRASDPLLPWAPPVTANLTVTVDRAGERVSMLGTATSYPAWEILAEKEGKTVEVYDYVPPPQRDSPKTLLWDFFFGPMWVGGAAYLPSATPAQGNR